MNYDYSGDFKASILFTYAPLHSFGSGVKTIRVYGKWLVRKDSTFDQGIMSRNAPRNPPLWMHQGTMIPWSRSYNYMNSMDMVGLEGLEPSTKGFTHPRHFCQERTISSPSSGEC